MENVLCELKDALEFHFEGLLEISKPIPNTESFKELVEQFELPKFYFEILELKLWLPILQKETF